MTEHQHFFIISPDDFEKEEHREKWRSIFNRIRSTTRNFGSERFPKEKLTIRGQTIEAILNDVFDIATDVFCKPATPT